MLRLLSTLCHVVDPLLVDYCDTHTVHILFNLTFVCVFVYTYIEVAELCCPISNATVPLFFLRDGTSKY